MAYLTQLEVHEACSMGDYDSLEEYISTGKYDLDCRDPDWGNRAPLHWACAKGYVDCIRLLLENEANGSVRMEQKWTPAHCAAEAGKLNSLRCLHTFNAPLNKKDIYGETPQKVAETYGHAECVKYLEQIETERREKKEKDGVNEEDAEDDSDDDELEKPPTPKPQRAKPNSRTTNGKPESKKKKPKS